MAGYYYCLFLACPLYAAAGIGMGGRTMVLFPLLQVSFFFPSLGLRDAAVGYPFVFVRSSGQSVVVDV